MNPLFGKSVLVTGADGFIGSHLTEKLVEAGAKVRALSQYNSFNYWGWLDSLPCLNDVEVVCGDVRDPFFCEKIAAGQEIIFNLAALIAIPYSYAAPQSYVETNVNGAVNICEAAKKAGVRRVLQTSTSEVYGTAKYVPICEEHPLQPQSPYSASKIGADSIALSYHNAFNMDITIVRPFNTYGPRQSARAFIPTIITQIAQGAKEIKVGDLKPTRDFNYVSDTCNGFLQLAACEKTKGETVNIGSNFEISMGDTLELIKKIMQSDVTFVTDKQRLRPENSEVFRLWCDNSKIEKLTGFAPQFSMEDGLRETVEWFINPENLAKYKGEIYNV
jgi:NAD dependent epimerase/dehydratase